MLDDYLSILRHPDLRLMIPARAISAFGDDMALLVLTLRVYSSGRGPWSITILLLCATIPVVVLAPVAGRLVDTIPFRTLASLAAVWQAACCVALAFADPLGLAARPRARAPPSTTRCASYTPSWSCSSWVRSSPTRPGWRSSRRSPSRTRSATRWAR